MIIEYYKGYLSLEKLRDLLKINQSGTTAYHIVEAAKQIGFESKGVKCLLDDINEDNIILPCIANVIINKTYKHFIVIYKIDFEKKKILIADPSNKIMYMSFDIFNSIFSGIIIILYPNQDLPCEKITNQKSKFIYQTLLLHKKLIKQVCILSFFITVFSIFTSFYLENILKALDKSSTKSYIVLIIFIFIVLNILKSLSKYFRDKIMLIINEKINLELTMDTFKKILLLPYKNYRNKTTGDIVTRLIDINVIKNYLSKIFVTVIIDMPLALCSMVILIAINSKLFFISLIILILYSIIIMLFKDYFDDKIKNLKKNNVETTNYAIECINNFETVKGLNIFERIYNNFEKKFVNLLWNSYKYENTIITQNFIKDLINDCGLVIIYGLGAILVIYEQLTFANLLTFATLLNYFYEPIKNILSLEYEIREFNLVLNRLLDLNSVKDSSGIIDEIYKGNIEYRNLCYTYDDKKNILSNINIKLLCGEKVIILGNSGSGKSTLMKLLLKYYEIERNRIFINDIDVNDYKTVNGVNYISQAENLFTDTLYNNLALNREISINKILEVSKLCYVNEIIENNRLGFNMLIEENGFNLSGGERQRIILARSLLSNFNILVIDEGLNQVDINLERKILKNLFDVYKNKTILVISHRLENLDLFDRKIVLKGGRIIEDVKKI